MANIVRGSERPMNILVLNSYHYTYPWTLNQNSGIITYLSTEFPDAVIYTEFLDWKRFPDESLIDLMTDSFRTKYSKLSLDLILTTDDKALSYALQNRSDFFSDAPIAFSGIIDTTAKEIIGTNKNVTGVYEKMDPTGTLSLMNLLEPDVDTIYLVHDTSESGSRTGQTIIDAVDAFETTKKYQLIDLSQNSFTAIKSIAEQLPTNSAIFMVSYNSSIDGESNKPEVFGQELSDISSVPIYSIDEYLLGNGITGGTFLSGQLQGEQLAKIGALLLKGTPADSIEHIGSATVYTAVDEDQLRRFNLDENHLDGTVTIINQRFSFYETYKTTVWVTLFIISALLSLIIMLILNIRRRYRYELELLANKDELQNLYEVVQASEEELLAQNEELEAYQEQLQHDAHYDSLTGLPNRLYLKAFYRDLSDVCQKDGKKLVLFFIDLNNFRYVNNTHGHVFGDKLLKEIAQRLSQMEGTLISVRLGGDEFIVLSKVGKEHFERSIKKIINTISHVFANPFQINDLTIPVSGSVGYSVYPDDGHTIDELIAQADMAMYEIKKEKKPYAKRFNAEIKTKYDDAFVIISRLKEAYENQEFSLYYQPQIDLKSLKIVGFEALLRWNSPEFGHVPPDKFIPLAESCGFIKTLGHCVIINSIQSARELQSVIDHPFKISVNVSVVQLFEEDFVVEVKDFLEEAALDPSYIQFEITESVMIESYDLIIERLNALRSIGISLSLDDFGTGYSSLVYLHYLPISELKIDKIFIDEINNLPLHPYENEQHALVNTILTLAKASDLCVVAEGVETQRQIEYLRHHGCDRIQGYFYSKPLPLPEIIVYCEKSSKAALHTKHYKDQVNSINEETTLTV